MTYWAYMLHCRGGALYVGHTDDLERRIGDHQSGSVPGFTAGHFPVEHVWSQEFTTRDEAKAAEKQIKGWSRAKKLALIRGDWERISMLAKGKSGPSTSSGETDLGKGMDQLPPKPVYPELVEGLSLTLHPHPETPPLAISSAAVRIRCADGLTWLAFEVAPSATLVCPGLAEPKRTDNLWKTTCFELFVRDRDGEGYREFNFSPSGQWAAYRFDGYRLGMRDLALPQPPAIARLDGRETMTLTVCLDAGVIASGTSLALSAVIEETDGTKSYWALAHPPGKPDFHAPACFALTLPPPGRT